jgi:conjugal transfer pilus assembly protein TrbC
MRRRLPLVIGTAAVAGLLLGLGTSTGAQTVDGLDLAKVRARARLSPQEAEALTKVVARRGEALRQEAAASAASARAASARYASKSSPADSAATFDFDGMVAASAKQMAPEDAPRLVAFASLSMPAASLKAMIADVGRAGGVIVFRGMPGNSARTFTTALAKVLPAGEVKAPVGIDPRLFRAFGIDAVPAYVVTATDFDLCDGFDCRTALPPHDRMAGNVSLAYALDAFAGGGGPAARVSALYRARLGDAQ